MPTGYTAFIEDKKVKTPKEFLHLCIEAYFYAFRDHGLEVKKDLTPIIKSYYLEQVNWAKERLDKAKKELERVNNMTADDFKEQFFKENQSTRESYGSYIQETDDKNKEYDRFIAGIEAWDCSPEFQNVKEFAIDQLQKSKSPSSASRQILEETPEPTEELWKKQKFTYCGEKKSRAVLHVTECQKEYDREVAKMEDALGFYARFKKELEKLDQ